MAEIIDPFDKATSSDIVDPFEQSVQPSAPVVDTEDAKIRQQLKEMNWIERQGAGAGAQIAKAMQGIGQLLGAERNPYIEKQAEIASEEAPIGAIAGEVLKYAPAALASGIAVPAAIAGGLGMLYNTTGDRLTAGALEGGLTALGGGVAKAATKLTGMGTLDRARNALRSILGDKTDDAIAALKAAQGQDIRSAQALADIPDAGRNIAALESMVRSGGKGVENAIDPIASANFYANQAARQEAERLAAMNVLAGGDTAAKGLATQKAAREAIEANLAPLRRQSLGAANVGGQQIAPMMREADTLSAQAAKLVSDANDPNIVRSMGDRAGLISQAKQLEQTAAQLRGQGEGLSSLGFGQINVAPVTTRIQKVLNDPSLGASENITKVLSDVNSRIVDLVRRGGGTIDANSLYMLRKEGINESIGKLLAGADPVVTKKLSAKLSAELKPLIDDAIESAGGTGWKEYITKYGKQLENLDRSSLMAEARRLYLQGDKQGFLNLVKDESPDVVKSIMTGKTSISEAAPIEKPVLDVVAKQLERDAAIKEAGKNTDARTAVESILQKGNFAKHLPNMLNRYVVLMNTAIKEGAMKVDKGMYRELDKALRDPAVMAKLIEHLPSKQRQVMNKMIFDFDRLGGGTVGGAALGGVAQQ